MSYFIALEWNKSFGHELWHAAMGIRSVVRWLNLSKLT